MNEDAGACKTSTLRRSPQSLPQGFSWLCSSQFVQPARNLPGPRVCIVSVRFVTWTGIATLGCYLPFFGVGVSRRALVRCALALFFGTARSTPHGHGRSHQHFVHGPPRSHDEHAEGLFGEVVKRWCIMLGTLGIGPENHFTGDIAATSDLSVSFPAAPS